MKCITCRKRKFTCLPQAKRVGPGRSPPSARKRPRPPEPATSAQVGYLLFHARKKQHPAICIFRNFHLEGAKEGASHRIFVHHESSKSDTDFRLNMRYSFQRSMVKSKRLSTVYRLRNLSLSKGDVLHPILRICTTPEGEHISREQASHFLRPLFRRFVFRARFISEIHIVDVDTSSFPADHL